MGKLSPPKPAKAAKRAADLAADAMGQGARYGVELSTSSGTETIFGGIGALNPAEYNRSISARQSYSDALGMVWGQDRELYDLYAEMRDKDPVIAMCVTHLSAVADEFPSGFVADEDDPKAIEIRDAAEIYLPGAKGGFGWDDANDAWTGGAFCDGFAVVQTMWGIRDGLYVPEVYRHEHPSKFAFTTVGSLAVYRDGKFEIAEPDRFTVARYGALYGNPFGASQLHGLRWLYAMKLAAMRGWLAFTEKYGLPIMVVTVPRDVTDATNVIANIKNAVESLDLTNGLILANGETIDSVARDGGKSGSSHQEIFIRYVDALITRRLLGGELNVASGESVGSYAQSQTHDANTRRRAVAMARRRDDAINRGVLAAFVRLNFGEQYVGSVRFETDCSTGTDTVEVDRLLRLAKEVGLGVTEEQAREMTGFRMPDEDDEILDWPAPAPTPFAGGEMGPSGMPKDEGDDDGEEEGEEEDGNDPAFWDRGMKRRMPKWRRKTKG